MTFDRVEKRHGGSYAKDEPQLAIYPAGTARFNKSASCKWLGDVDVVEFYVDREGRQLGIARGGDPDDAWALISDGPGYGVSFRGILSQFGLSREVIGQTVYLDLDHDASEGLLVADAEPLFDEAEGNE
ncbi:hypothetical protein [Halobellus sp. H-GB7]|uniref:hypothetical protein n=1 Tax=Halobellus sp. H-GB7 TaxID=3069756 RepID=UPI0027B497C0|nr:hypothetical protein [Halobellus sp. H-GB7]MDQ2053197.1 hypothetical protein [Halobellus sp. H-GB7]